MEKVINALEEIQKMDCAYGIPVDGICSLREEITEAKVCTPVIGKFSSGKSALVNTLLGYTKRILREDITPETAIPAEILYTDSEDRVTIIRTDGTDQVLCVEDYRKQEADATNEKCVRIQLRNHFLQEIPDVMLVDMPGFESGFEIHNQAIDNYLPHSLAYIITFPADDMILRSSVGNILKELCLHDMPLCVVITKYDKKNDDFETTFQKLKESLKRFVGNREITYCKTSSFTGDAEEVEEFLKGIQKKSRNILAGKYKKLVLPFIENTENYLKTTLNGSRLSESELDRQEEKLQKQLSTLDSKFSKEREAFDQEISECVGIIQADVQKALEAEVSTLAVMTLNNQSVNDYLNSLVRNTVTISVKQTITPKVEGYLKRVTDLISKESVGDVHISVAYDAEKIYKGITGNTVAVASAVMYKEVASGIISSIILKLTENKRRQEAKQAIIRKLRGEVFPQVTREVGNGIERTVTEQIRLINASVEASYQDQKTTLEKAMADLRQQINGENTRKENLAADINADLERIEGIKDGLR